MSELIDVITKIILIAAGLTSVFLLFACFLRWKFPYARVIRDTVPLMEIIQDEIPGMFFQYPIELERNWKFRTNTPYQDLIGREAEICSMLTNRLGRKVELEIAWSGKVVFLVDRVQHKETV